MSKLYRKRFVIRSCLWLDQLPPTPYQDRNSLQFSPQTETHMLHQHIFRIQS